MKIDYRILFKGVALIGLAMPPLCAVGQTDAELLKEAKISKSQAEKIALAKVPNGKIQSEEIENEQSALVWSFDIARPDTKDITEVLVNARTGEIVDLGLENPAAQAREHATDQTNH